MDLNLNVTGSMDALKADKDQLEKDFQVLHEKADEHAKAVKNLKSDVITLILELAKVVRELVYMSVKRS